MLIVLVVAAAAVCCGMLYLLFRGSYGGADIVFSTLGIMCVCALVVIVAIVLPVARAESWSRVLAFEATIDSLAVARAAGNQAELAAIQHKVIEENQWLVGAQYWARSLWCNWFWHPAVLGLEPIQ